jgi:signal transduction histidine kinase/DNA-binding response OmpR family regulator/ligand-binding sensor domain-containing protein
MKKLILLLILLSNAPGVFCQFPQINFENISVRQGLPDRQTFCIMQDRTGFIWIGGDHGLYKYNGYNFTYIKTLPGCRNCRALEGVFSIKEDNHGFLWILSEAGIARYDPANEKSMVVHPYQRDSASENSFLKKDLIIDSHGNIWSTGQTGLIKISSEKQDLFDIQFFQLSQRKYGPDNNVNTLYEDHHGNIWAGCVEGLYVLKPGSSHFTRVDEGANHGKQHAIGWITKILELDENEYLVTADEGLYVLTNTRQALRDSTPEKSLLRFSCNRIKDGQKGLSLLLDRHKNILVATDKELFLARKQILTGVFQFESLYNNLSDPEDIGYTNFIRDIFEDRSGELWITHSVTGMSKFNLSQSQFANYKSLIRNNFTSSDISPIYKDKQGNLWSGALGGGLYKIQPGNTKVTRYPLGSIRCMEEVSPGIFWIGQITGITEFNAETGQSINPFPKSIVTSNLNDASVFDILKDGNQVYVGTITGLFVFNQTNKQLYQYSFNSSNFSYNYYNSIVSMIKMKNGEIWAGSCNHGINKVNFDPQRGIISLIPVISGKFLNDHGINIDGPNLYEDSEGYLWVADVSKLHRINLKTHETRSYELFAGIEFPGLRSIIGDDHYHLWIGTTNGLCRLDIRTGKVKVFGKDDGVPITMHDVSSVYKDQGGRLYFGGIGGFYSFHPDSFKTNDSVPTIVITQMRLFNKPVSVDTSATSILKKNISYTRSIQLKHSEHDLSFEFASLDYNQSFKNKYAYKLEGYQKDWIETDAKNNIAHYTNLSPSTYTFRVKGSNNDGVWNDTGTSLTIVIHPPWWATTLARVLFGVLFIVALVGFVRWRLWRLRDEKDALEKLVRIRTEEIEEQKEEIISQKDMLQVKNQQILELDQIKNRFFTNISHEFRTPLSLIQSPVEELMDDPRRSENDRRKLNMIQRNAHRLLQLVNQLLDISKIDGSQIKLELVQADVMKHLRAISGAFTSLAESKSIHFQCNIPVERMETWFDPDKLEKIAGNLLSNAFKFTPDGGEIVFTAEYVASEHGLTARILRFSVRDTGVGIPDKSLEKIFDRFYQVETSVKKEGGGTGIGLSLARDMVRLQHGDITVESELCQGSKFTVTLPLGKDHLKEQDYLLLKKTPEFKGAKSLLVSDDDVLENKEVVKMQEQPAKKPLLLIVEDNRDIRMQLSDNLQEYTIQEAVDGVAGLKKATELIPDLVLTDLMMPRMDGIELCRKLKTTESTSHIPVILLTAKVTVEDKITGLQTGADDYVPKPFHMAELKARIANLIESRRKLRERFGREVTLEPKDIVITPMDEQFLNRAIEVIEKHMNDENFDVPEFRSAMNMSRSTLFRKLFALTNQSPTEFIRTIRLKRAASLLKQHFGNVSEVAMEVGFSNPSYFTKCFRDMYGVSPVDYMKEQVSEPTPTSKKK